MKSFRISKGNPEGFRLRGTAGEPQNEILINFSGKNLKDLATSDGTSEL